MRAVAAFPDTRHVALIDRPEPEISQPDHVLLEVLDVGICGTDKEICTFEYGTPPPGDDHLVIGHEALARVLEVGPDVADLRPGDLVVPTVRRPCPDPGCLPCRTGNQDYCATGRFTERGIKEAHGFMADRIVEHERFLVPVPAELRDVAVLTEPLTIAEKAFSQTFWMLQHRPPWLDPAAPADQRGRGLSAVVLGVGPVGLLGAMAAVSAGFTTFVYSRELPPSPRSNLVTAVGATYVSSQERTFAELAQQVGNIDLVYEAVGHSHFALQALAVLGTNGIFILTGVPGMDALTQADPARLMRDMVLENQVLMGTVNAAPVDFASSLRDIVGFRRHWPDVVGSLIAGRHPPDEAAELVLGRPSGVKTVISFAD